MSVEFRQELFAKGRQAFEVALPPVLRTEPDARGHYFCPLCLTPYPREALVLPDPVLTIEDVPPQAGPAGGHLKLLTCKSCNTRAGGQLEGELAKRRRMEAFGDQAEGVTWRATLEPDDDSETPGVRIDARWEDGGLRMTGVPERTNPEHNAEHWSWWDRLVKDETLNPKFTVHLGGYHHGKQQLAVMKAAYLAAFASFGYSYVWRPQLDIVREAIMIADPSGFPIEVLPVLNLNTEAPTTLRVTAVHKPVHGLWIQVGRDFVLLPSIDSAPSFWEQACELASVSQQMTVTMERWREWPTRPEYRLDLKRCPDLTPQGRRDRGGRACLGREYGARQW